MLYPPSLIMCYPRDERYGSESQKQNFEIPSHYFIEFAICFRSLLLLCASRQLEPVKCSCNYTSAQDKSSTNKIEATSSQGNVWHAWSNSRHALVTSTLTPQNNFSATSEYSQGERKVCSRYLRILGFWYAGESLQNGALFSALLKEYCPA